MTFLLGPALSHAGRRIPASCRPMMTLYRHKHMRRPRRSVDGHIVVPVDHLPPSSWRASRDLSANTLRQDGPCLKPVAGPMLVGRVTDGAKLSRKRLLSFTFR